MSKKQRVKLTVGQLQLSNILGAKFSPLDIRENLKREFFVKTRSEQCKKITETILNNPLEVVRIEKNYPDAYHHIFAYIQRCCDEDIKFVYLTRLEVGLLTLLNPLIEFQVDVNYTPYIEVEVETKVIDDLIERAKLLNETTNGILTQFIKAKLELLGSNILTFSEGDEEC